MEKKGKGKEHKEKNAGKHSKKEKEADYLGDLQRVQAEFENFRKRVEEEKKDWAEIGKKEMLLGLLDIYGSLEKAAENGEEGVGLVFEELRKFFEKNGVEEIECLGEKFDGEKMHVMNTGKDEGKEDGIVLEVFKKGFMFKESVLRPALVQVNKLGSEEK